MGIFLGHFYRAFSRASVQRSLAPLYCRRTCPRMCIAALIGIASRSCFSPWHRSCVGIRAILSLSHKMVPPAARRPFEPLSLCNILKGLPDNTQKPSILVWNSASCLIIYTNHLQLKLIRPVRRAICVKSELFFQNLHKDFGLPPTLLLLV